jgi:hypothetical protein
MTQYSYHSGPLAEVKAVITAGNGRTVVMTYKPPLTGARVSQFTSEPAAAELVEVPAAVEIKFQNGTVRSFNAETGEWISEVEQGKKPTWTPPPHHKKAP